MNYIFIILFAYTLNSETFQMCETCEINTLNSGFSLLNAGDTLFIQNGEYSGGNSYANLKGSKDNYIYIIGENSENVIFKGNNTALQLSDCEYIQFENVTFSENVFNGVNIDDAGTYETPTHHINFINCTFRDMQNTGNNDLLKLSGLDNFLINGCSFINGSAGGSGIDMVGCHSGTITENEFLNMGSNSIQNKGGTSDIDITRNKFIDGGLRAINIGGSTGLEFFRPQSANYESKNIKIHSNLFFGSDAPFAFVGTINSEVINNTIVFPNRWLLRILQENTNDGFEFVRDNKVINNIFLVNNSIQNTPINIGPNTLPETFEFKNNLYFNIDNPNWTLNTPSENENAIFEPPMLNIVDFILDSNSIANGKGYQVDEPKYDYYGSLFLNPRTIGAEEIGKITSSIIKREDFSIVNTNEFILINSNKRVSKIELYNLLGKKVQSSNNEIIYKSQLTKGVHIIKFQIENISYTEKILIE